MNAIADTQTITIVGGGLAGALCSIYLAQAGFKVEVFERSTDPRRENADGGRSINLALAERGIAALRQLGLHHRIAQISLPMRGRMIHPDSGPVHLQPYGRLSSEVIYSIHRAELNRTLLTAAERTKRVRLFFGQKLLNINFNNDQATFIDQRSGRQYQRKIFPLIACDGAGSRTRRAMEKHSDFQSHADLLDHAYRELTLAPSQTGTHQLAADALHIWPRQSYMMIGLPNLDGSFTATLFMAQQGNLSFAELSESQRAKGFFSDSFPDALPLIQGFEDQWQANPLGILGTVRCPRWHLDGRALLLGDAAHAIVPFHGQGMNAAFGDCPALIDSIEKSNTWEQAFEGFQIERQTNTNAIADMALENYLEMRDSVVDPGYRLRRALERELEQRHPRHFVPRYSMVMFHTLPYVEAQQRGKTNLEILLELTKNVASLDEVDYGRATQLIQERLAKPISEEP